jgi:hypothetical protein
MNERKDLFIAMLIFVTASAPVFAQEHRVSKQSPLSIHRVDLKPGSWCLHTTKTIASIAHSSPEISVRQPHRVV